jgi:hypothetical protein
MYYGLQNASLKTNLLETANKPFTKNLTPVLSEVVVTNPGTEVNTQEIADRRNPQCLK